MRRWIAVEGLVACFGAQAALAAGRHGVKRYLNKESTVDLSGKKSVFLGWVDMVPDDWAVHGYDNKEEWATAINRLNNVFQRLCETKWLAGRTVVGAKNSSDTGGAGEDLRITFSDVRVDYDDYHLFLAIHFVDPKTNTELAVIPVRPYYGNDWGFEKYLRAALEEVSLKVKVEVTGQVGAK